MKRGAKILITGLPGSGKTTLCSIAGGILSAIEGRIVVGGEDISNHDAKQLTKFRQDKVGFVFQSANLVPFLTAREHLAYVAIWYWGVSCKEAEAWGDEVLVELVLAADEVGQLAEAYNRLVDRFTETEPSPLMGGDGAIMVVDESA